MISTEHVLSVSISLANSSIDAAVQRIQPDAGGLELQVISGLLGASVASLELETYCGILEVAEQMMGEMYRTWRQKARRCANTNTLVVNLLKETCGTAAFLRSIEAPEQIFVQDDYDLMRLSIAYRLVDYSFDRGLWFWTLPYTDDLYSTEDLQPIVDQVESWAETGDDFTVRCIDLMVDMEHLDPSNTSAIIALYVVKTLHDGGEEDGFYEGIADILAEVSELINDGSC